MKMKRPAAVSRRPSSDDLDVLVVALRPWVKLVLKTKWE
jgi:hypothetical protein